MPTTVLPTSGSREGAYVLLEACLPGRPPRNIGVLIIDPATDRGWLRLRERFGDLADPEDAEVLDALDADLRQRLAETGALPWLAWMWRHGRIRLEPLHPEFEAWDVEPNDFAVVAEWLRVIE